MLKVVIIGTQADGRKIGGITRVKNPSEKPSTKDNAKVGGITRVKK